MKLIPRSTLFKPITVYPNTAYYEIVLYINPARLILRDIQWGIRIVTRVL